MKKFLLTLAFILPFTNVLADDYLIDVRSSEEFSEEHISNALNFPHTQIIPLVKAQGIKPDDNILLYCRSGRRAEAAKQALLDSGFKNVKNLGGINDAKVILGK